MADAKERIGQSIGDYRLLRLLGTGTFGTVYQAEHLHDQIPAAVKLLHLPLTGSNALHAFLNEARTIRLRHPHIVPILDFGLSHHDDLPYLVMAYVDRGSLRDHYSVGSKLPHETIDTYVQQLASALQYAHDCHIIHRDVKPENMLVRSDGTVQLSDFGIARISEHASQSSLHKVAGTPAYAAPEQSEGQPCPASDQYALAIVVYEWLSGQIPFQGAPLALMLHHHMDEPPSLQSTCSEVSPEVEQVIFKALAKAPEDRFLTITHFAEALHTALQKDTVLISSLPKQNTPQSILSSNGPVSYTRSGKILHPTWPTPHLQKQPPKGSRRRVLIALLCLVLLLSGSGTIWLLTAQQQQQQAQAAHSATPISTSTSIPTTIPTSTRTPISPSTPISTPTPTPTPISMPTPTPVTTSVPTTPTPIPIPTPTPSSGEPLTVQITNIPNTVQNWTTTSVGVTTNKPACKVHLVIKYKVRTDSTDMQDTDSSGHATLSWNVHAKRRDRSEGTATAQVTVIAQDQQGHEVTSQPVTVEISNGGEE